MPPVPACVSMPFAKGPVWICDAGAQPGVLDAADLVLGATGSATPLSNVALHLEQLLGRPPVGVAWRAFADYVAALRALQDTQYPGAVLAPDTTPPSAADFAATVAALGVAPAPTVANRNLAPNKPLRVPDIVQLAIQAREDLRAVEDTLASWPAQQRRALVSQLVSQFVFRPVRSYQPDADRRRDEILVGAFTEHHRVAAGHDAFPIATWLDEQRGRVNTHNASEAPGTRYWHEFLAPAAAMGTSRAAQEQYFATPKRLALLLRSLVGPRQLQQTDPYRYYTEGIPFAAPLETRGFAFGTVTFYAVDHVLPRPEVIDAVATELMRAIENDLNPIAHIVFTPNPHGARRSIAAQGDDPLVPLLGIDGDYLLIGLDAVRRPSCTAAHELGHQWYWQLVEDGAQQIGPYEATMRATIDALYAEAMATDGGEFVDDATYTGLLDSGHPFKHVEFFPALRHAFVEHGEAFFARLQTVPPDHYAHTAAAFMAHLYGHDFRTTAAP